MVIACSGSAGPISLRKTFRTVPKFEILGRQKTKDDKLGARIFFRRKRPTNLGLRIQLTGGTATHKVCLCIRTPCCLCFV
jgi:hypothetical protein